MEYISTSILAKNLKVDWKKLFQYLSENNLVTKKDGAWILTKAGEKNGGKYTITDKGEQYITWPVNMTIDIKDPIFSEKDLSQKSYGMLTATKIAEHFKITAQRLNLILSEIGWIEKQIEGWAVTPFGKKLGAKEIEHFKTGIHFVVWPKNILENKILHNLCEPLKAEEEADTAIKKQKEEETKIDKFRSDLPGTYRTKDGHWVRSRAEVIIDDALYYYGIPHAYERKIPVEENIYSDFYLPQQKVYIEFWGYENNPKYLKRKEVKQEIYKKYDLNLIELNDNHIKNLDDHLPRFLLQYGIRVF